jgi:hypothetical protein
MTNEEFVHRALSKRILERKFRHRGRRYIGRMIRTARRGLLRQIEIALGAALLILLVACTVTPPPVGPTIVLRNTQPDPDASDPSAPLIAALHVAALAGANDWSLFGVDGRAWDGTGTECSLTWFDGNELPCDVTVSITYVPQSELGDTTLGLAVIDDRTVYLDVQLSPDHLESIAAHEIGHCLWHSNEHLPTGDWGIMMADTAWLTEVSAADADYAAKYSDGWAKP